MLLRYEASVNYRGRDTHTHSAPVNLSEVRGRDEALAALKQAAKYVESVGGKPGTIRVKEKLGEKPTELVTTAVLDLIDAKGAQEKSPYWIEQLFIYPPLPY